MIAALKAAERRRWEFAALLLVVAGYIFVASSYARHGTIHNDEGFYAEASREVMRGRIPYRDFAYTQTPVLPYVQGVVMAVVGYGVREQRWINVAWSALAIAVALLIWRRAGLNCVTCLGFICAWFCPQLVYYSTIGKTYGLAQFFLLIAAGALYLRGPAPAKLWLLSTACVLAIGCRLTVAPAALLLWCGLASTERGRLSLPSLVGVPVLLLILVLGPFIAADPGNAYFWLLGCHLQDALPKLRLEKLGESLTATLPVTVLAAFGLLVMFSLRARFTRPSFWIFSAGVAGWLLGVGVPGIYADYAMPFLPLVIVGAGCLLAEATTQWVQRFCLVMVLALTGFSLLQKHYLLSGGYLEAVDRTAAYVRANTKVDDVVLTSMPETAVVAGRKVYPALEMGKFGFTGEMDQRTAHRRHTLTWADLNEAIETQRAPIIVLSRHQGVNFSWSLPSLLSLAPPDYRGFAERLLRRYHCTYADDFFLVFERAEAKPKAFAINPDAL